MKSLLGLLLAAGAMAAVAAEPAPDLPPADVVARILKAAPAVRAADSLVRAEEANRNRLAAGSYEWNLRLGASQRRVSPAGGSGERYREAEAALERPLRLPGKAALDAELGAQGVEIAETGRGDALHEAGRALLKGWFAWLREGETARQWANQATLLGQHASGVQRRQQLGDAARLDGIQAEAARAQAEAQLAQARLRERSAAEDLRRRHPGLALPEIVTLSEPPPIAGGEGEWVGAILEHSHELGVASGETRRAATAARRSGSDRLPDPTVGLHVARERSGEEKVLGLTVSIPLPGQARGAAAEAALAQADAASSREAAALQKVTAEAATLYHAAVAARVAWESSRQAARQLRQAADMTARAYQLGEGSLTELLAARRLANEAGLAARLAQLDALELRYRLLLDAHRLWPLDDHGDH